jgi:hypothetical protein
MANFDINGPVSGTNTTNPGAGTFGTTGVESVTSPTAAPTGDTTSTPNTDGTNSSTSTASGGNTLSNGDLPWAPVALPTTSAGQGGLGEGKHGLKPESWVIGYFLDGEACQQPIITGVIAGGPGAGSGRVGGSGSDGSGGGSGGSGGGPTGGIDGNPGKIDTSNAGGDNTKKAFDILVKNGYSPQNAAGIVGNLYSEGRKPGTTDINPNQNQIGGGGGYGIAQWTSPDRKEGLKRHSPNNWNTMEGQMSYLIYELRTKEKTAERLLQNSRDSVDRSALAFLAFERPKGYIASYARANGGQGVPPGSAKAKERIDAARKMYAKYGNGGGGSSASPTPAAVSTPAASSPAPTLNSTSTGNFALTGITSK